VRGDAQSSSRGRSHRLRALVEPPGGRQRPLPCFESVGVLTERQQPARPADVVGLLPSHDNGASWGFICEDALGLGPTATEDPSIGLTANNSLIAGVTKGLNVSTDVGCNWNCIAGSGNNALSGEQITDIAVRPDAPSSAVAITNTYVTSDSAQDEIHAQVYETTDNGVTWTAIGKALDRTVTVQTIDVAKTDSNRLYVPARTAPARRGPRRSSCRRTRE
jgi:photosystem II stability/assembly factor-like uncharacterized protein